MGSLVVRWQTDRGGRVPGRGVGLKVTGGFWLGLSCEVTKPEDPPMTDEMMSLRALLEKSPDADLLREMIGFASERLMELEVGALTGRPMARKVPSGLVQRNGFRERDWQTRAGTVIVIWSVSLGLPGAAADGREGADGGIRRPISGISTRSVDDLAGHGRERRPSVLLGEEIDERVNASSIGRSKATAGLWIRHLREGPRRNVPVAVIVVVGVNGDGPPARRWAWRSAHLKPRSSGAAFRKLARRDCAG